MEINGGEFIDNYSGKMSGLITCEEAKSVTIKNAIFKDNDSDGEGTIEIFRCDADIDNCTFINNHGLNGGAVKSHYNKKINISNCKFFKNGCQTGGAIYAYDCEATVKNCLFKNNYAYYFHGGAINVAQKGNLKVYDSEFLENGPHSRKVSDNYTIDQCPRVGGAISVSWRAKAEIKNCLFKGNVAADSGGAIYTYKFTNKNSRDDYAEIQEADAYDNLKIDEQTQFIDNYVRAGYFAPPLNFKDFKELKFKSNSFTGKGYPPVLSLDKTLLNNYDVNYVYDAYIFTFDANGGVFRKGGPFADDSLFYVERVNKYREYEITNIVPVMPKMKFIGWEDEDGAIHKIGDTLPPANRSQVFKAVWEPFTGLIPQTGDTSNIVLYMVLAVVAIGIFGFILSKRKNKNYIS